MHSMAQAEIALFFTLGAILLTIVTGLTLCLEPIREVAIHAE